MKPSPYDHYFLKSSTLSIARFNCPANATDFTDTGPIQRYLLAFPTVPVKIRHAESEKGILADHNTVTIYNRGQHYERTALHEDGDRCYWLGTDAETASEMLRTLGHKTSGYPERLFPMSHGASPHKVYFLLHTLEADKTPPDSLFLEEVGLKLFHYTLKTVFSKVSTSHHRRANTEARHRVLAEKAQAVMCSRFKEPLSLSDIAKACNTSPFHLARIFQEQKKTSLHRYLSSLRLRASLRTTMSGSQDLSHIATEFGFSDHSHYSAVFRRTYGVSPSALRNKATQTLQNRARFL